MASRTVWAVRDVVTKRRLSYRYRSVRDAREALTGIQIRLRQRGQDPQSVEMYRTSMPK